MRKTVLIVEDDLATRLGLAQLIVAHGHEAILAATFEQGRRLLRTHRPDLLITDIRLGDFNGLQLIVGELKPPPAIVLTGFADPVIELEARRAGALYLVKPLPPETLLAHVDAALSAHADGPGEIMVSRQWQRKPIAGGMAARVDDDVPATIRDVSYGGLRLKVPASDDVLPSSFTVSLPTGALHVPVDLVWQNKTDDGLECGVALAMMNHSTRSAWLDLVDSIA